MFKTLKISFATAYLLLNNFYLIILGMYDFRKITSKKNSDRGAYFHELFLRGRPGLSRGILRQRHRSLFDPKNEPNLNMFPPMHHTPDLRMIALNVHNTLSPQEHVQTSE